ncbi:hypothetical protein QM716_11735 [Rhodococcus sp. IEGM 1409]|uniref:hypothetical protein n=1 Tax=Rhodococcus sp. IEGM 1409 TaxID=3047082 RepID=UPI0024B7C3A4|nr:hypothetical protein [Rhodococcus sp. IEGM 1409]MDI9900523.1 hypothetical protein [Rhodococcus sp. IEGM 1409]
MSTETVVDIISTGVVIGVPWHLAETVVDVISTATVGVSVTVDTQSVVEVVSQTIQIVDVVSSETIVDIIPGTTVKPSPTVTTNTVVDIASTSSVKPSPTINTETVVDIASTAVVIPSPTAAGETIVDIASTATVKPSPTINTNTTVDILSEGTIIVFTPMGMLKSGPLSTPASNTRLQVTGWTQDPAYPGSVVSSDALVVNGAKTATVTAAVAWQDRWFATSYVVEIRKNGVLIPGATITGTGPSSGTGMSLTVPPTSVAVIPGDQITLWASGSGFGNTILAAGTYLRIS